MKTRFFFILLSMICLSCSDKIDNIETVKKQFCLSKESKGVIYPHRQNETRNVAECWENWSSVVLPSGISVTPPWYNFNVTTTIPTDIRMDIKKDDGWTLIAHTINSTANPGTNYLIFYNKLTGLLKVFYYLEEVVMQTSAIWKVHIDSPQHLLGFTGNLSESISCKVKKQDIYCMNITTDENKGYTRGWNCFQLQLAYDPNFITGYLTINPISRTSSNINLTGSYQSKSEGTIITTTTSNPTNDVISGIAKASGKEAKSWLTKEVENGKIATDFLKHSIPDILSGGTSGIVKAGIDLLFGSFLGKFNKQNIQESKLEFTTNGTAQLEGTISTEQTGGLTPITINISNNMVGILGVWNLLEQPTTYFSTTARYQGGNLNQGFIYSLFPSPQTVYRPVFNSTIKENIIHYSFNSLMLRTTNISSEVKDYDRGSIGGTACYSDSYKNIYENIYEQDFNFKFKVHFPDISRTSKHPDIPGMIFAPKGRLNNSSIGINIRCDHLLKVRLMLITSTKDTIVSTRTFLPKFEWDPQDYELNNSENPDKYIITNLHSKSLN